MSAGAARGHDLAAVHARARADVDEVIGAADRVLVVLDHDHGVADVAQVRQRRQQARVVALVQPDRGLVEDVHHADQAGTDLARQADALRLAARERVGAAVQRQVIEPHVDQEAEAAAQLLQDLVGDLAAPSRELEILEIGLCLAHPERGQLRQRTVVDEDVARLGAQPSALAGRAAPRADELRELLAHQRRVGLAVAALEVVHDAFEVVRALDHVAAVVHVVEADGLLAAAVEHALALLGRQFRERRVQAEAVVLRQRAEQVEVVDVAPVPAADRALRQARTGVLHDALHVEELLHPEAVAARAGAGGVVEREQPRLQRRDAVAAVRAREARGEHLLLARLVHRGDDREPLGQPQRGLEGFRQAQPQVGAHAKAVHHHLDGVLALLVERGHVVELGHDPVDAHAHEAAAAQLLQHLQRARPCARAPPAPAASASRPRAAPAPRRPSGSRSAPPAAARAAGSAARRRARTAGAGSRRSR